MFRRINLHYFGVLSVANKYSLVKLLLAGVAKIEQVLVLPVSLSGYCGVGVGGGGGPVDGLLGVDGCADGVGEYVGGGCGLARGTSGGTSGVVFAYFTGG